MLLGERDRNACPGNGLKTFISIHSDIPQSCRECQEIQWIWLNFCYNQCNRANRKVKPQGEVKLLHWAWRRSFKLLVLHKVISDFTSGFT